MNINIQDNRGYTADFQELLRAFSPYLSAGDDNIAMLEYRERSLECAVYPDTEIVLTFNGVTSDNAFLPHFADPVKRKAAEKRQGKIMLYKLFCGLTGVRLPYGSLTGIRPTKLYREIEKEGIDAYAYFTEVLSVAPENAGFIREIVENQRGIYTRAEDLADVFVNIPICTTRCSYCSFISAEYGKILKWIEPFVSGLLREIEAARSIIADNCYRVRAIYVGGGTPTSLETEDFRRVLSRLKGLNPIEFTVEAGRPDTITREKLQIMADCGVTRISINPQSFNEATLLNIGRAHTTADIEEAYRLARNFPFDINMDLIAMLPGETLRDFKYSLDKCIDMRPDNITVHSLSLKRGSALYQGEYTLDKSELPEAMAGYSREALAAGGYKPYYMYRQKNTSGNLENAGYAKEGKECVYNIDIMEESISIIANGAGGIGKRVFNGGERIERKPIPKGIDVYKERIDSIIEEKARFFKK